MYKTLLIGAIAVSVLGAAVAVILNAVDANGGVGGVVFVLTAAAAGLIGGEVSRRMPPRRRR